MNDMLLNLLAIFSEKAQWQSRSLEDLLSDQGASQLLTDFHKSVSHKILHTLLDWLITEILFILYYISCLQWL